MKKTMIVLIVAILVGGVIFAAGNGGGNGSGKGERQQQQVQESVSSKSSCLPAPTASDNSEFM